jgi:hypothetical protein
MTCACAGVDGGSPQGARARAPRPRQELRNPIGNFLRNFFQGMWHRPNFPFCGGANRCTGAPLSSARSVEPIEGGIRRSARYGRHVVLTLVFGRGCRRYRLPRSGIALLRTAAFGVLQYVAHSVIRRWRLARSFPLAPSWGPTRGGPPARRSRLGVREVCGAAYGGRRGKTAPGAGPSGRGRRWTDGFRGP